MIGVAQGSCVIAASYNCCIYASRLRILETLEVEGDKKEMAKRLLKCLTIHCTSEPKILRFTGHIFLFIVMVTFCY